MMSIRVNMRGESGGERLSLSIWSGGRLVSVVLLGVLSTSLWAAEQGPGRPNLLFIWTDEQRADTMAAYGNTKIHAPNLDKLASESIVFRKAYVTQPVCTPSRSSVMTGLWPHTNGCTTNNVPLAKEVHCLPELITDRQYRTAYMGKWHLGDEIFTQHGFEEMVSIEDGYARYYGPGRDRTQRSDYHHFLIANGYKPDQNDGTFGREFACRHTCRFLDRWIGNTVLTKCIFRPTSLIRWRKTSRCATGSCASTVSRRMVAMRQLSRI